MKIIVQDNTHSFDELNIGDLFLYSGKTFIKTSTVFIRDFEPDCDYNCVDLKSGYHHFIEPDTEVTEVEGTLNIRVCYDE